MAYFWKGTNGSERAAKILADIVCAALILVFAIIFFGPAGGFVTRRPCCKPSFPTSAFLMKGAPNRNCGCPLSIPC